MSAPGWMPLHVAEYVADTTHLSTVEHGAYLLLIMHYWQNRGLPADDAKLARICRMPVAEFTAIRDTLAEFFADGWTHKRIDAELAKADEKYEKRASAGRKGGIAKSAASNATAMPEQCSTNNTDIDKEEEHPSPPSVVRSPQKSRGEFLPQDWKPCIEGQKMAVAELGSRDAAVRELAKFKNYWFAKSGTDGRKRDWEATWRNWIMRAADDGKRNRNHQWQPRPASGSDNALTALDQLLGGGSRGGGGAPVAAGYDDAERDAAGVYRIPH